MDVNSIREESIRPTQYQEAFLKDETVYDEVLEELSKEHGIDLYPSPN